MALAGGVLLDLDCYIWHIVRYRTFNLREAMARFQGHNRLHGHPRFFHSVEFLAVLAVASSCHWAIRIFALGVAFHILLDLFVHKKRGRFWLYPDWSNLHCLIVEWLTGRTGEIDSPAAQTQHTAPTTERAPEGNR